MCTGVRFSDEEGNMYFGRNLDWSFSYGESILATPRGYHYDNVFGASGKATPNAVIGVGVVMADRPMYFDCANEHGLAIAGLNFPGYAEFVHEPVEGTDNVATFEFPLWVARNFDSVDEVEEALKNVTLVSQIVPGQQESLLHWIIGDSERRIVVGVGPAPFTGLRAGIVTAKALAFATGAQLVGQDVLAPQCLAHTQATDDRRHLTLAVNDARRRQLYFALYDGGTVADGVGQSPITLIDMDIDYPDSITMRVNDVLTKLADTGKPYVVDVIGHGAVKYAQSWNAIASLDEVDDHALLDEGAEGLARFAAFTTSEQALAEPTPVEPLYLRRPDVSVPNPLKHVLNHAGAERTE